MSFERVDQRAFDEIRKTKITPNVSPYAEGSAMIEVGGTKVLCMASVDESIPRWLRNQNKGWVTAEYAMLPRSTHTRMRRENLRPSGRTMEIQRLIGRSLRAVVDMKKLGERQIMVDCDVLQADGGTRCASITGAYVALNLACRNLVKQGKIGGSPIISEVAAISVGIVEGNVISDLKYEEDSNAEVDMNVVCTGTGKFIEIQGTAEQEPFDRAQMDEMLALAEKGVGELFELQRQVLNPR